MIPTLLCHYIYLKNKVLCDRLSIQVQNKAINRKVERTRSGCSKKTTNNVQSVKFRHQYFRFFEKKVVNIAITELRPVSNESLGNSTYYRGDLKFLNPSIF